MKDVVTLLSELPSFPTVKDPVYQLPASPIVKESFAAFFERYRDAPNNLAAGLDPATVIGHAKAALAAWPTAFLGKVAM